MIENPGETISAIKTNNHYELNDWEEGFIQSIENQLSLDVPLTSRQLAKLKEVYDRCFGNG